MEKFEELLRKMGKGWFILKLAEDNGINVGTKTYYGKETAMKARLQRYEATKNIHKEMLDYLLINWNSRISAGEPVISNKDLFELAKKI
jgi:hypothetical protein